jgi:hypothetical protein
MTFARTWTPAPKLRDREPPAVVQRVERAGVYAGSTSGQTIAKEAPVRSEPYRRLVAARPCKNCGRIGRSQAAHPPPTGKAIKQDDRLCFPLCADELARAGCHPRFDQYVLFPYEQAIQVAKQWGAETRAEIVHDGDWPAGLERMEWNT